MWGGFVGPRFRRRDTFDAPQKYPKGRRHIRLPDLVCAYYMLKRNRLFYWTDEKLYQLKMHQFQNIVEPKPAKPLGEKTEKTVA
jgi:hypothetical protein